jgi:CheY-like chemotaxis protein
METHWRVLVVDDDAIAREMLLHVVRMRGHQAVACEGAEEALCLLAGARYDVLLTDHVLDGMCGAELLRIVRQLHPTVRCLVLSGRPAPSDLAFPVPWLMKPLRHDDIERALAG